MATTAAAYRGSYKRKLHDEAVTAALDAYRQGFEDALKAVLGAALIVKPHPGESREDGR